MLKAVAVAAVIIVLWLIPGQFPDWVTHGHPDSIVEEEGLLEQFQWPLLALGCILMVFACRRCEPAYRAFYSSVLLVYSLLCWREIDFDKVFLGERWYEVQGYIGADDIPIMNQVILGLIFLGVLVLLVQVARKTKAILGWYKAHRWFKSHVVLGLGGLCFVAATLFDRSSTIKKNLNIDLNVEMKFYWEESLELVGMLLFAMGAIELLQLSRPKDDSAPASESHSAPTT
jgi:hypothetical protein